MISFLAALVIALNGWDAFSTVHAVSHWGAREVNPFMHWALQHGPWCFVLIKMGLAALGTIPCAWRASQAFGKPFLVGLWILAGLYWVLGVYHAAIWWVVLRG